MPRTIQPLGTFRNHVYDLHDKNEQLLLQTATVNQGNKYNLLIYVNLGYIHNYNDNFFVAVSDHSYDLEGEYCSDIDHQNEHVPAAHKV